MANKVRREEGCLRYDYYFKSWDEDTVLLFEEWESKKHQEVHLTQPHIADLKAIKEKYIIVLAILHNLNSMMSIMAESLSNRSLILLSRKAIPFLLIF